MHPIQFRKFIELKGADLHTPILARSRNYRWARQRDSQENPIGSTDGSFGFVLRSVSIWGVKKPAFF